MRGRAILGAIVLGALAHGDPIEPIHLEYHAAPECPDEAQFAAQVWGRTTRARLAAEADRARRFSVEVRLDGRRARGRLRVQNPDGAESAREVSGDTCAAVVDALALVTALAIDPHASLQVPPKIVLPSPSPSPSPLPVVMAPSPPPRPRARLRLGMGIDGAVVQGILPSVAWEVAPYFEAARAGPRWSALVRLGFVYDAGADVRTSGGSARLAWYLGRLDVCPGRIPIGAGFKIDPCVRLEAGAVVGRGIDVLRPKEAVRPWVAPALLVNLEREFWNRLYLHVGVAVSFPLIRDTFVLDPDFQVEAVPAVGVRGAAGLGVHFL